MSEYRKFAATSDVCWVTELIVAARDAGDTELARYLKQGLRLRDLRESLKYLNWALFGRRLQRLWRCFKPVKLPAKWDVRPDLD